MEQHMDEQTLQEKIEGVMSSWAEDVEQHIAESQWYGEMLDGLLEEQDPTLHREDMRERGMHLVVLELMSSYSGEAFEDWKRERREEREEALVLLVAGARETLEVPEDMLQYPGFWLDLLRDAGMATPPSTWTDGPLQWLTADEVQELEKWIRSL